MHVLLPLTLLPLLAVALAAVAIEPAAVLALLAITIFGACAPLQFARLTGRLRLIWLSLLVLYTCLTPGEYIFASLPWCPLTYEGVLGAASQSLHLLAMLALVSFILEKYSPMILVSGLYQWLSAWRFPSGVLQAAVVRIFLVMQSQAHPHARHLVWSNWPAYFSQPQQLVAHSSQTSMQLQLQPLLPFERLLLILMLLVLLILFIHP